jgi:hypothetical protein
VEGLNQRWLTVTPFLAVTLRTALILRGFILEQLAVFIDVVAYVAVLDAGVLIMFIMHKHRWRALRIIESAVVHDGHVLLGPRRGEERDDPDQQAQVYQRDDFHLSSWSHTGFSITS